MHRFFSPAGGADAKRPKVGEDESEGSCESGPLPRSFLSLNVNGLKTRVDQPDGKWLEGIAKLVQELDPDVIAMQEIKLTAKAPPGAKKGDGKPRQRNQPWDNDKQTDWLNVKRKMLEREPWCRYIRRFSCADWRYAGTLTLFRRGLRKPEKVFYNLELEEGRHDDNGRACIAQYSTGLRVANFYVPNNGWTEESNFASRRAWDAKVLDFVRRTHQEQRQLVVVGDLNVAHQDADVTHPEWFLAQTGERSSRGRVAVEGERILEDDKGQPGFTRNEQLRFSQILEEGHLVDTWRELHPVSSPFELGDPAWTWRGSEHVTDKYHARGMRIDYCLVSRSLRAHVQEASILGRGVERWQGFFGSDHSPIFLRLAAIDETDRLKTSPQAPLSTLQKIASPEVDRMAEQGSAGGDLHLGNALSKGEAHVGKEELEKDKDVEGGMASDVAVGKGRGQGAPAVGGSKAAGRDIPEEASAQSKSSQGGVSVAHFFLKKRPSSVGNGATREAKGADDEGLRSEVAVGKDDVYMDLSGDSASKGLVACGKGGKGDAERSGDGGVGGKGGVGGGKGGVERSGGLPGNDGRNTLQRPHKLRRHNAAVHTHPVCGGVQGGGEEGDESGAGVKQHASESVALPAVEHQADLKQFVLRLHDLPGRSQTGGGLEERAGEDADVVDDQARLTYVLRKRKGQQAMDMNHTFTPQSMRGRGIAEHVTLAAFDYCKKNGYKVIPSCTYISDTFLARHPELLEQVAK